MASKIWTFTESQTFEFTGSSIGGGDDTGSVTASIECWGAGGHGTADGTGGSGGAYAVKSFIISSGSYTIVVGTSTSTDGGSSSFIDGADIIVTAAGGKADGTITGQIADSSGSTVYAGGIGGANFTGYSAYNGGAGGGAGGAQGNGEAGQSGFYSTEIAAAKGGQYNNTGVDRFGGSGSYYYAGAGVNRVVPATTGDIPGCGGGGGYDYGTDTSAAGGAGLVSVWIDSTFS